MTTSTRALPSAGEPQPLEQGDRLTAAEFMRRYEAEPDLHDVQLIEGVVHMPSPVSTIRHGEPHTALCGWLFLYRMKTPGIVLSDNSTVVLDVDNVPQPDVFLCIPEHAGGQTRFDEKGYVHGPPELVAEVSSSTVSIDLHDKLNAYRRAGVKEYVVWRVRQNAVDWFTLHDGRFVPQQAVDGVHKSTVFPGLWLNVPALLQQDLTALATTVEQGCHIQEHADFSHKIKPGVNPA